jgi:hypothetical protein
VSRVSIGSVNLDGIAKKKDDADVFELADDSNANNLDNKRGSIS